MTEIEQSAGAFLLFLVSLDDGSLGASAGLDRVAPLWSGRGEDPWPVRLEPGEERGIAEQPVFHHLGIAGAELAGA